MIYLGHFSFHVDLPSEPTSDLIAGTFTAMVDAKSINAAVKQFRLLLRTMPKGVQEMLEGVSEIYLDSCSEINRVPKGGFVPFFSLHTDSDEPGGVTVANQGATTSQSRAFNYGDEKTGRPKPFVRFSGKRTTKKTRIGGRLSTSTASLSVV